MINPSVDIIIATHARVGWLEEALKSALWQQYDGQYGVLILNDCPEQKLVCNHPRVRVINEDKKLPTLGDKRNRLLRESTREWVAFFDDDDILMPWHLRRASKAVELGFKASAAVSTMYFDGNAGHLAQPCLMDLLIHRQTALDVGGFISQDNGDEHQFIQRLKDINVVHTEGPAQGPSYLYIWGNGVFHVSGMGQAFGGVGFREDALQRLKAGTEPSGTITMRPHTKKNYIAMHSAVMRASKS